MLPKLARGVDPKLHAEADWQMCGCLCWYSTAKGMVGCNKKASAPHASFKGALENAGNCLCSLCLAAALCYHIAPAMETCRVHIQGARRWHSRMRSSNAWVCQPNKADDVSLWLLLDQLITLRKLWSEFCTLLALGMLIRYSSSGL